MEDERFSSALKVLQAIESGTPTYVPGLWWLETANGLLMSERRKRSTRAGTQDALRAIAGLPVITDEESPPLRIEVTMSLAREYDLTIYDASYLELALRRGAALATADQRLAKAAKTAGVIVHGPTE